MTVLTIHDATEIKAWLVGETAAEAEQHIRNGYPDLLADWQAGSLVAAEIDVPEADLYSPEHYGVVDGAVVRG